MVVDISAFTYNFLCKKKILKPKVLDFNKMFENSIKKAKILGKKSIGLTEKSLENADAGLMILILCNFQLLTSV
jgi:hypothetical protein